MTRINSHQLIQMVGQDQIVFVEDYTGDEVVEKIIEVPSIFSQWEDQDSKGKQLTIGSISLDVELAVLKKVVNYFVEASKVSLEDQLEAIQILKW